MSDNLLFKSILFCLATLVAPAAGYAAEAVYQVLKVQGKVEILDEAGHVRESAKAGSQVLAGDTIRTGEKSTAAIKSEIGDTFVLDASSTARARGKNSLEQLLGKVLYMFTKGLGAKREVHVQTAVMGIRGTTFLVDAESDQASVGLKEGSLEIDSTGAGFNLFQRKAMDEFDAYKQGNRAGMDRMKKDFETYRAKTKEEFIAFKKSFLLKPNQSLSISGDKAVIDSLSADTLEHIQRLEQFLNAQ